MPELQFVVQPGSPRSEILPIYPCSGRGAMVSTLAHGTNVATNKLVDDFEKHLDKCKTCKDVSGTVVIPDIYAGAV